MRVTEPSVKEDCLTESLLCRREGAGKTSSGNSRFMRPQGGQERGEQCIQFSRPHESLNVGITKVRVKNSGAQRDGERPSAMSLHHKFRQVDS